LQARLAKSAVAGPPVATDSPAFSLRFSAKTGIVAGLDAPVGFAFEIIDILALKSWS
jgi:hypothetical protein